MLGKLEQRCIKTKSFTAPFTIKTSWHTRQELRIFESKEELFKRMKIVSSNAFQKYSSAEAVEASSKIAYLIALAKKPHNIGGTSIKPCMLKEASLV